MPTYPILRQPVTESYLPRVGRSGKVETLPDMGGGCNLQSLHNRSDVGLQQVGCGRGHVITEAALQLPGIITLTTTTSARTHRIRVVQVTSMGVRT